MANCIRSGCALLRCGRGVQVESVRWRRVNVQRPRAPHYERAMFLALVNPTLPPPETLQLPPSLTCKKKQEEEEKYFRPDNPYERLLAKDVLDYFNQSKMVAFCHTNPISGEDKFQATIKLKKEGMHLKTYSRHTIRIALDELSGEEPGFYDPLLNLFKTHSAIIFCEQPKAGALMKILRKVPQIVLMAALVEGRLLSVTQLKAYNDIGNLTTGRSQLVGVLQQASGSRLVSQLTSAQLRLVSQLDHLASLQSGEHS